MGKLYFCKSVFGTEEVEVGGELVEGGGREMVGGGWGGMGFVWCGGEGVRVLVFGRKVGWC